jgi:hypothetical protein
MYNLFFDEQVLAIKRRLSLLDSDSITSEHILEISLEYFENPDDAQKATEIIEEDFQC